MKITNNIHNIVVLDTAELIYNFIEQDKVAVGALDKKGN
jgi:hypothetical protein